MKLPSSRLQLPGRAKTVLLFQVFFFLLCVCVCFLGACSKCHKNRQRSQHQQQCSQEQKQQSQPQQHSQDISEYDAHTQTLLQPFLSQRQVCTHQHGPGISESMTLDDLRTLFSEYAAVSKQLSSHVDYETCTKLDMVLSDFLEEKVCKLVEAAAGRPIL